VRSPTRTSARLVLTVLAAVGATAALLVPLAPVRQEVATYSWPVANSTAPVGIPLYPYHPEALTATFSCDTVAALAGRRPDATVLATTPAETAEGRRDGLVVRVVDGELRITSRGRVVLVEPVGAADGCAWRLVSDGERTEVARDGVTVSTVEEDIRPQVLGVFSDLETGVDDVTGLLVRIRSDTRFQSSPTPWKQALVVLAIVGLAGALVALRRLDDLAGTTRSLRALPRRWWRPRPPDLLVLGLLALWAVIGPFTVDDGYILTMVRARPSSGFVGNYYRWFNAPEAPFGFFYELYHAWSRVSSSLLWMRLPALLLAVVSWLLVSRLLIPRLGKGPATSRWLPWAAAVAFLAAWMPYNNGIRPEPFVVVGTLVTFCAVERSLATRRMVPLALGIVAAVTSVAITPTGLIALLPLLVAPRRLVRVVWLRRDVRWAPVVAVVLASGLSVLTLMFYDQPAGAVAEATRVRAAIGPSLGWEQEIERYSHLLHPLSVEGSVARRVPVLLVVGSLVLVGATLLRRRTVPGVSTGPVQRLVLATALAFAVISVTPTKWTHHFGAFAGFGAAVLALAMWTMSTVLFESTRARAAAVSGIATLLALSLAGANNWWFVSTLDGPWTDRRITVLGVPLHTTLLAGAVAGCLLAVVLAAWRQARGGGWRPSRLPAPHLLVSLGLCLSVAIQLATFVGAALEQRDSYSIAKQNVRSVASTTCGLADSIALELTPLYGALTPLAGAAGRDAPGVFAVNGGFAAGHVPPYGFGGGDPAFDVPVWGSLVGEDADRATGTARSGWYEIAGRLRDGSAPLVIAVAGRTHGGNAVTVELGRRRGDAVDPRGGLAVEEFAHRHHSNIDPVMNRLPRDRPEWRDVRIDLGDKLPPDADVLRVAGADHTVGTGGWLAFSAPRAPELTPLTEVVPQDAGVVVDWPIGAAYPCTRPASLALGAVEMPSWRIAGGPLLLGSGEISFTQDTAGPFAPVAALADQIAVPAYLVHEWDEEVATVFRIQSPALAEPALSLSDRVEPGWSRGPRLVIPGVDDVQKVG